MIILGISGKACVGKDTAADHLVKNYGFVKIAFADVMKRICMDTFGFTEQQLWGVSETRNQIDKRYNISPRKSLQNLGDWGRGLYAGIWIQYTMNIAKKLSTEPFLDYRHTRGMFRTDHHTEWRDIPPRHVVISDTRYFNEVNAIKDEGGIVMRLLRPEVDLEGAAGRHSSESNQKLMSDDIFNSVIDNSGTIPDLYHKMDEFIKPYL